MKVEFQMAVDHTPTIYRSMYRTFADLVIAYDASSTRGVVVYCRVEPEVVEKLTRFNTHDPIDDVKMDTSS